MSAETIENIYQTEYLEKIIEREKKAKQICAQLNHFTELKPTLITVISQIKELSGCEAISIRLHDQGDYPYYVYNGFPDGFIKKENSLCSKDKEGEKIPLSEMGGYELDCMCGNIIHGRYDSRYPFFSSNGSFWSNHTTLLLASTTEEDRQARTRNYCNSCGYESVALVPIKSGKKNIGLIQMNDKRIGMFSERFIQYIEMIGEQIGLAVENSLSFETIKNQKNKLEDANKKLKALQDELVESRKIAALGNLVAGVAHEINTPVGIGITGITALIQRNKKVDEDLKAKKFQTEDIEKFIRFTDQSGQLVLKNLNRIADLIKNFKQIYTEHASTEAKSFKLKSYFEELANSLRPRLKERNIKTKILCEDDLMITSHPGALGQIMINLIMNSIVHGFAKAEKGTITIKAESINSNLEILYEDDGMGIKPDLLPKIFDPFVTSNKQSGAGLGLNIAYNIVKQTFNGSIRCESSEKDGVHFFISIPLTFGDIHGE